jgi:phosphate-selective porin OprO/OprP
MTKTRKAPKRISLLRILLWASVMGVTPSAFAQTAPVEAEPPADAPSPEDPSLLTVAPEEANMNAAEARAELLEAQLASLQAQLDELKKQLPKATPTWKGAPQWEDKDKGFAFKVRGRLMYDVGYVNDPGATPTAISSTQDLGFNSRVPPRPTGCGRHASRRFRL